MSAIDKHKKNSQSFSGLIPSITTKTKIYIFSEFIHSLTDCTYEVTCITQVLGYLVHNTNSDEDLLNLTTLTIEILSNFRRSYARGKGITDSCLEDAKSKLSKAILDEKIRKHEKSIKSLKSSQVEKENEYNGAVQGVITLWHLKCVNGIPQSSLKFLAQALSEIQDDSKIIKIFIRELYR